MRSKYPPPEGAKESYYEVWKDAPVLFTLGALAFGIAIFYLVGYLINISKESWPLTEATIDAIEIRKIPARKHGEFFYDVELKYRYKTDDHENTGTAFYPDSNRLDDEADAARIVRIYQVGRRLSVHYNPNKVSESFIEPSWKNRERLLLGIAFGVGGIFCLYSGITAWRRKPT